MQLHITNYKAFASNFPNGGDHKYGGFAVRTQNRSQEKE